MNTVFAVSPCVQCRLVPSGSKCLPRHRARCSRFLNYIRELHRARSHKLLINELRELIVKPMVGV